MLELMGDELSDTDPTKPITTDKTLNSMLPWLKHNCKITITLPALQSTPKQGYTQQSDAHNDWYFLPGRNKQQAPIHLSKFQEKTFSMFQNKKLFNGWKNNRQAHIARQVRITSNVMAHMITACHVSAKELTEITTPTSLLAHAKLLPNDKSIWD